MTAGKRSSPDAHQALSELCERYWYPLYAYVRCRISDAHEAQDLTQAFFAEILDKGLSALNIIDSDFSMLNEVMARHYGLPGPRGSSFV